MSETQTTRRREIAQRARAFYAGKLPRSEIFRDVTVADYADPLLKDLLELLTNQPKKSRFSGLWGKAYDKYVQRAHSLIEAAER
jgi:hypothetical protein